MNNQMWNRSLLNPLWGSAISLLLGLLFAHYVAFGWLDNTWPIVMAKLVFGFGAGGIYYALCVQPATPIGHRGVVKLLSKRIRMGPEGMGFLEGINGTPLPVGLMTLESVDVREQTMELGEVDEYTTDNNTATVEGSIQWKIKDPYDWKSVANGDVGLKARALQAVRDVVATHNYLGVIKENKEKLSDAIRDEIMRVLREHSADADKETLITDKIVDVPLVQIRSVRLPDQNNVALNQVNVERVEREAEKLQAKSRRQQVDILTRRRSKKPSTIDERLAYMGSLADAGRTGVNMAHFSADQGLVNALTSVVGNFLTNFFANRAQTPATPTPNPTNENT